MSQEVNEFKSNGTLPRGFASDEAPSCEFSEFDLYDDATAATLRSSQMELAQSRSSFQSRIMRKLGLAPPDPRMFA